MCTRTICPCQKNTKTICTKKKSWFDIIVTTLGSTTTAVCSQVHRKNRASTDDNSSSSKVVVVTCREVPRYQPHVLCVSCGRVPSKKACRYSRCGECCRANKASICAAHGTGVSAAVGIVEGALEDKPLELDLSYMNLKKCPPRIGYVGTQLACLNLINNRLTELPEEIGLLRGLEELFLQYNCLEELPVRICLLKSHHTSFFSFFFLVSDFPVKKISHYFFSKCKEILLFDLLL